MTIPTNPNPPYRFKPVHTGETHRWLSLPFDLKFDAKWTNQVGSSVSMNVDEDITLRVDDRSQKLCGMRFSTGDEWIRCAKGRRVRVAIETRSATPKPIPFRLIYLPQDAPHSGFFEVVANPSPSETSFEFDVPAETDAKTHLVVVDPALDETDLVITKASLEILS